MKQKINGLLKLSIPFLVFYGVICLVLAFLQRSMLYFPTPLTNTSAAFVELCQEEVKIRVSLVPNQSNRAVIYFGGNAEDVSYSLSELSISFPESAIYAMHYRGYSGSTGKPSESALSDASCFTIMSITALEIIVIEEVLGGLATPLAAAQDVHRLILMTPFGSMSVSPTHLLASPTTVTDRTILPSCTQRQCPPSAPGGERSVSREIGDEAEPFLSDGNCWSMILPGTDHNSLTLPSLVVQQFIDHPNSLPASLSVRSNRKRSVVQTTKIIDVMVVFVAMAVANCFQSFGRWNVHDAARRAHGSEWRVALLSCFCVEARVSADEFPKVYNMNRCLNNLSPDEAVDGFDCHWGSRPICCCGPEVQNPIAMAWIVRNL